MSPEGSLFDKETKSILKDRIGLLPEREKQLLVYIIIQN